MNQGCRTGQYRKSKGIQETKKQKKRIPQITDRLEQYEKRFPKYGKSFFVRVKSRNPMTEKQETQTNEEQATSRKPDGILTKKITGKTFVTEIYFDEKSKETFQDRLLKVIHSKGK